MPQRQPTSGGIWGATEPDPDLSAAPKEQPKEPAFDPDKFLKETEGQQFDPDKFLKETAPESKTYAFGRGAVQGALYDVPEAIGQIFEHATGLHIPIPQDVRDWFYEVRRKTEETGAGQAGRFAGGIGSLLVAPELAIGGRAAVTAGRAAYSAELARAAKATEAVRAAERAAAEKAGRTVATPRAELTKKELSKAAGGTRTITRAEKLGKPIPGPRAGPMTIEAAEERAAAEAEAAGLPRSPNVERTPGAAEVLSRRAAAAQPLTTAQRTGRVLGQAAGGAAIGAAQPVEDERNFARQKAWQALSGGVLGGLAGTRLGEVALKHMRRHPYHYGLWPGLAMAHNPWLAVPALSTLAGLWGLRAVERAGPKVTIPIGVGGGQFLRGTPEETENDQTE